MCVVDWYWGMAFVQRCNVTLPVPVPVLAPKLLQHQGSAKQSAPVERCRVDSAETKCFGRNGVALAINPQQTSMRRSRSNGRNGGIGEAPAGVTEQGSGMGIMAARGSTLSISEGKRTRRSRIAKELLERGASPIDLLESLGGTSKPESFWMVVNTLSLNSRVPEALLVFEWWRRQDGHEANEQQYASFINICGHAGIPEQGQKLFDEMVRLGIRPTVTTYSCLLQGFAEVGNFDRAKGILAEMTEVGIRPNAITYTGLLHAYGKQGFYSEMAKVFNDMKTHQTSQPECAPTNVTYSSLLQCYAKGGLFVRMEKALKEMTAKELHPDGNAVNAMIQGYALAGLVKEMERMYSLVRPYGVKVREDTIRAVARTYIRKSYFFQLGAFARHHNRRRMNLGKLIENLLLLSHAANFAMRGLAEEFVRLKEGGFEADLTSFNIRALAFSRMQMLWDIRVTILEMVHQDVMPDLVTYGAVVDAYLAGNLQASLPEALADMQNLEDVATVQTDDLVFEAFGKGEFQISCEELIMESKDVDGKHFTYANLVGYHLQKLEISTTRKVDRSKRRHTPSRKAVKRPF